MPVKYSSVTSCNLKHWELPSPSFHRCVCERRDKGLLTHEKDRTAGLGLFFFHKAPSYNRLLSPSTGEESLRCYRNATVDQNIAFHRPRLRTDSSDVHIISSSRLYKHFVQATHTAQRETREMAFSLSAVSALYTRTSPAATMSLCEHQNEL